MTNTFTWLHLSDLHLTCKKDSENWTAKSIDQDMVIRSLLEAIEKELIKKEKKPSLIFITGDLVHGGQADEYQVAKEFCEQLLKITSLPKDRLFIVPGNHDVNRNEITKFHIKRYHQFDNQDDISDILSDAGASSTLFQKLENFYKFYNDFFDSEIKVKDHSIITQPIEIAELSIKINLLGLNSALFAGYDGDDKNKLAFGSYQVEQALQALQAMDKDSMLSIAFFHHPFSCFHPSEEPIQNQIKQHADIILTGHLHDPSNMSQHDSSGKVMTIGAGASYETRESENSFNLGVVNTETGKGKIQFYKYISRQNRWTKNTDVNLDEEDGHFPFEVPSVKDKPITSTTSKSDSEIPTEQHKKIELQQAVPTTTPPQKTTKQAKSSIKIAILTANPINKNYDYKDLIHGFKKLKCDVHYHSLSCDTLNELDGVDYIFILSKLIKNKVVIEDEHLGSSTISFKELEENIFTTGLKGLFIFLNQAIESELIAELSLPTVVYSELSKNDIKKFIFQTFKQCNITSFKDQHSVNQENLELCILNNYFKSNTYKTSLPDEIDPRTTLHYVGRTTDLEILCKRIIDLKNDRNGFLTLKGSGGIGKTVTVKKIIVELANRHYFPDGIDFVDCEFITDYKMFEFNVARTFNLEQSINVKEYIKNHDVSKGAFLILDNFETLLHLPDKEEIKSFLNFICDYVTIIVTSRELIGLECEQYYELRRFTTDEAIELFLNGLKRKIDKQEIKFLRNEIIETLLDNNPLAIKLITNNLPKGKNFAALKKELEEDIFEKLTDTELEVFDSYSDTNIERKKSLYASINFSYCYLTDPEKEMFELLSLFPDGIDMESLKRIKEENRHKQRSGNDANVHRSCINDQIIKSLDSKSMIENNNGVIRLQSIMGKFAEQKLSQREDLESVYHNAFNYNDRMIDFLSELETSNRKLSLTLFNSHKGNFLKSITYINKFKYEKYLLLQYISQLSFFYIEICTNTNFIKNLTEKQGYFNDKNEKKYLNIILLNSRYYDGDFKQAFIELIASVSKTDTEKYAESDIEKNIITHSLNIYGMEGEPYFSAKIFKKINYLYRHYPRDFFYIGEYDLNLLSSINRLSFILLEIHFNLDKLSACDLESYLKSIYKKNHIELMSCYYLKAKMGDIDKQTVNKLVLVNPYTQGLQQLIFAFSEMDRDKANSLYEEAINNLKHIKYYYVEALFFYAKFLKTTSNQQHYEEIYTQGFELAKKHYFRFLIYKFEDLVESKNISYDSKNYPLPNNDNFDDYINILIKNNNKTKADGRPT